MSQIIFLHGASSSGKSTIARALQQRIEKPFWHISIDHLRDAGVLPRDRFQSGEFDWSEERPRFFAGFHQSLASYAAAGNNLILEHILDTDGWIETLVELFEPHDVFFVAVHCSVPVLNEREFKRGDRPLGSAEMDQKSIHQKRIYDLEIQSEDGVDANVQSILEVWRSGLRRSEFSLHLD